MWKRALGFCLCLCLASCGENKYGDHPPFPAKGVVTVNGKPAKGASVTLFHDGDWGPKPIVPQAWTNEGGEFTLYTYGPDDGAPAGDYRVTVEWFPQRHARDLGPDYLGGKFSKADKSGLTAHIDKGENKLEFKLEISEAQAKANETAAHESKAVKASKAARRRQDR